MTARFIDDATTTGPRKPAPRRHGGDIGRRPGGASGGPATAPGVVEWRHPHLIQVPSTSLDPPAVLIDSPADVARRRSRWGSRRPEQVTRRSPPEAPPPRAPAPTIAPTPVVTPRPTKPPTPKPTVTATRSPRRSRSRPSQRRSRGPAHAAPTPARRTRRRRRHPGTPSPPDGRADRSPRRPPVPLRPTVPHRRAGRDLYQERLQRRRELPGSRLHRLRRDIDRDDAELHCRDRHGDDVAGVDVV